MKLSVVAPIFNEEKSLAPLCAELKTVLDKIGHQYEIIGVDDASTDGSFAELKRLVATMPQLRGIRLLRNSGQTAALQAGIDAARGDVIILIDSDLENDPNDIPRLLEKINEGFDVVSGWRKHRWHGNFISILKRKVPSVLANWCISRVTKVHLHDFGCTLKAYTKEVIKPVELYGEMHRFIPFFAKLQGARITEIPVNYRQRQFGSSNYGISRTFRVLLDLGVLKFFDRYFTKPIHFFGKIGFYSLILAVIAAVWSLGLKIAGTSFISTPLPIISAMFLILAVLLFSMGVMSELLMRIYFSARDEKMYKVREMVNL